MREIEIRQIEIFLTVARCGNISQAARALYTSQSSISNWISKMEADCGMTLFFRTNRGVSLTPQGEALFSRLDVAYNRFRVSVTEICQEQGGPEKVLRIGYLNRADVCQSAEHCLTAYHRAFPTVKLQSEKFNYHELRDKLLCEELDLGISVSFDISSYPDFSYVAIGPTSPSFLFPSAWAEQAAEQTDLGFLSGKTLILEAPTARSCIMAICENAGIQIGSIRYVNSYIYQLTLIKHGIGFSICSDPDDADLHPEITRIPVTTGKRASIVVAWRKDRLTELAAGFVSALEEQKTES